MEDFDKFVFRDPSQPDRLSSERIVYKKGNGPGVILMHELPGMIPECVDLARRLAEANFTVYLPLLFGEPNSQLSVPKILQYVAQLCISKEFYLLAKNQSSPIADWLKALCRQAKVECGGNGVGVIGMCLTGGFVLSLMADDSVIGAVASQPSLPLRISQDRKESLGVSPQDLAAAKNRAENGARILALRFSEDATSPPEKFIRLQQEFGQTTETLEDSNQLCWKQNRFLETIEINSKANNPYQIPSSSHAVLTLGYDRDPKHPTNRVFCRVVKFLKEQFSLDLDNK